MLQAAEASIAAAARAGNLALELRALTGKVQALTIMGARAAAQQTVEEMLVKAQGNVDDVVRDYALGDIAFFYIESGDLARAIQLMRQGAQGARKAGDRQKESSFDANLGYTYSRLGLYAQARTVLEAGLELAEVIGDRRLQARHLINLGIVRWRCGDLESARQLEERALHDNSATSDPYGEAANLACLGYILEEMGNPTAAIEYLRKACAGYARIEMDVNRIEAQAALSRCLQATGRQAEARQLAAEAWEYLRSHGADGMDSTTWAYGCIIDVLDAIDIPERFALLSDVIELGNRELMRNADKISDAEWRRSYLENVTENRAMMDRWNERDKIIKQAFTPM